MKKRPLTKRIKQLQDYKKNLEGVIIFVNTTDGWCNVELGNGTILYQIKFDAGINPRLKRIEQHVELAPAPGNKTKYIVIGSARKLVKSNTLASKGGTTYDSGARYNERYVWL